VAAPAAVVGKRSSGKASFPCRAVPWDGFLVCFALLAMASSRPAVNLAVPADFSIVLYAYVCLKSS
jgi:hypothetical protein